nr:hypothetical protein [Tanacetum cinerariifolium]
IQPSKASDLPSSLSGRFKEKNGGTKVTPPYGSSSIPISKSYALLEEESEEEVENVFDESVNLLSSSKIGVSTPTGTVSDG